MNVIDAICLFLYFLIFAESGSKDSFIVLLCFAASVVYTSTGLWVAHSPVINHLVITLCFIPSLWFLSKVVCLSVMGYIVYHWVISGDYLFYPGVATPLSSTFIYVSPALNAMIMVALIYAGWTGKHIKYCRMGRGWLPDYLHNFFCTEKMEGRE